MGGRYGVNVERSPCENRGKGSPRFVDLLVRDMQMRDGAIALSPMEFDQHVVCFERGHEFGRKNDARR